MLTAKYREIAFSDQDVVNPEDFIPANDSYNPHRVRPWLIHEQGFTLAVVFASTEQDALDIAVDNHKLDDFLVDLTDKYERGDYLTSDFSKRAFGEEEVPEFIDSEGVKYWWKIEPAFLGNASEPFDIESVGMIELPTPTFSFVALFNAIQEGKNA